LKKYFIVHSSTIITLIFGVINQLILVSYLPSAEYGYLVATIAVSLIPVMMTVTSQTNLIFENKSDIVNNKLNLLAVFGFFIAVAYLVSLILYFIIIDNKNLIFIFILVINVLITSALEFASALFIVKGEKPIYIALTQLSNTFPRTIFYVISIILMDQININSVAIAALFSFLIFISIVRDKITLRIRLFKYTLFKIGRIKSMSYGVSNLFLTFINQSPILIALRVIGPEFSGTVAFSLFVFNFLWNVPADIYKRYRLNDFHQFVKINKGIKKLFSFKELGLIVVIAITVSFFSYFVISSQFISATIESFKKNSTIIILTLLVGIPFRYASIYLSSLMLNSLYTRFRTVSYSICFFCAILLYVVGAFFLKQNQYIRLIITVEIIMFLVLFIMIKILIKNEKNIN
jgi:Flp pilus assembly pilin Flp